ncbi:MAG TPA: hypothetical protein ENH41_01185 [Candidatus Omnitrophica bacterium]|nr:hypothetical protein [Candidatus Omnitrophota bacterium]
MLYLALGFIFASVGLVSYQLVPICQNRLKGKMGKLRKAQSKVDMSKIRMPKVAAVDKISKRLQAIFIEIPSQRLFQMYIGSLIGFSVLGLIFTRSILGAGVGFSIALIAPSIVIKQIEAKRKRDFTTQLVDTLMIFSSSLKAGLSLIQAMEEVVTEMPAPISQEFSLVTRENRMGVPLEEALVHLKDRMQVEELDLVITAILVARETGGNLTRTFSRLTSTIREKSKLIGRVKSLCTQAMLQGYIMIMLPIAFAIMVFGFNPGFFTIMIEDKVGQALLAYAIISEIIGAFLIFKLSKIEV